MEQYQYALFYLLAHYQEKLKPCIEARCGWYDSVNAVCSVRSIPFEIEKISNEIRIQGYSK